MEEELWVELVNKLEDGKFECALYNEEGEEKYKFTLEISEEDLMEMTDDISFMDEITQNALENQLKEEIISLIMDECDEFSQDIDYHDLSLYDNSAAGDIVASLSDWLEQRVYECFNNIYSLNNKQLEEMKKFYKEGIDLNLAIKREEDTKILGSKFLSAEEMQEIRHSKEKEWMNMKNGFNKFKEELKFEGVISTPTDEPENGNIVQEERDFNE